MPAHAATVTAGGDISVAWYGTSDSPPEVDPPHIGTGFFEMRSNRMVSFEFEMLGFRWTLEDIPHRCPSDLCGAHLDDPSVPFVNLVFEDEQGSGWWAFSFLDGVLFFSFSAGPYRFSGTSDDLSVFSISEGFAAEVDVPEPRSLALLSLGLLGLGWTRRARPLP